MTNTRVIMAGGYEAAKKKTTEVSEKMCERHRYIQGPRVTPNCPDFGSEVHLVPATGAALRPELTLRATEANVTPLLDTMVCLVLPRLRLGSSPLKRDGYPRESSEKTDASQKT